MQLQLKNGDVVDIDFDQACAAADRIVKVCRDMGFVPPEASDVVAMRLRQIAMLMDGIATSLHMKVSAKDFVETQQSITDWANATFGRSSSNMRIAARANEEMAELLRALSVDDANPKANVEVADVVIVLMRLASYLGIDLAAEIDRKMAINRQRQWNIGGDGHGYHVRDKSTEVKP